MLRSPTPTINRASIVTASAKRLSKILLAWYDRERRTLPWRAAPGKRVDPYRVWLSEIMLQQTTVAAVVPYYEAFLARWPTVEALAKADLDAVLHAWQGLGYYARARNLHRCARVVAEDLGGRFPESAEGLRRLTGIGDYTAAAIAAMAFGRPEAAVDGNVVRVLSRMYALETPLPDVRSAVRPLAEALVPRKRPGDFAQALMDLGATVCTPRRPACDRCPWAADCSAFASGTPEAFPKKAQKKEKPTRRGAAFWTVRADGAVLLRRRPESGLLGGMMEVPTTDWRERAWTEAEAIAAAPVAGAWRRLAGTVRHTFTHFHLELDVYAADVGDGDGLWCPPGRLGNYALPTVMKKVARLAGDGVGGAGSTRRRRPAI